MRGLIMTAQDFIEFFGRFEQGVWSTSLTPTRGRRNVWMMIAGPHSPKAKELRRVFQQIDADPFQVVAGSDRRFEQRYAKERMMAALEQIQQKEQVLCDELTAEFARYRQVWGNLLEEEGF